MNLQDMILNQLRTKRSPVSVFLTNGYKIRGIVVGFDPYVIVMDVGGAQNVVYKHAISTIAPSVPIALFENTWKEKSHESD